MVTAMAPKRGVMRYPPPAARSAVEVDGRPVVGSVVSSGTEADGDLDDVVDRLEEVVAKLRQEMGDMSTRLDIAEGLLAAATGQPVSTDAGVAETVVPYGVDRANLLVEAASTAQRAVLLSALAATRWNLTAAAEGLRLAGPGAVIRYIKALGLVDEYNAARARGDVRQGRPRDPKD